MILKNKLKAKITECGMTIKSVSKKVGIDPTSFYRKAENNSFRLYEVDAIVSILGLTAQEATDIFFARKGA